MFGTLSDSLSTREIALKMLALFLHFYIETPNVLYCAFYTTAPTDILLFSVPMHIRNYLTRGRTNPTSFTIKKGGGGGGGGGTSIVIHKEAFIF